MSVFVEERNAPNGIGTRSFVAPELVLMEPDIPDPQYTTAVDIYSFGATLFFVVCKILPVKMDTWNEVHTSLV